MYKWHTVFLVGRVTETAGGCDEAMMKTFAVGRQLAAQTFHRRTREVSAQRINQSAVQASQKTAHQHIQQVRLYEESNHMTQGTQQECVWLCRAKVSISISQSAASLQVRVCVFSQEQKPADRKDETAHEHGGVSLNT